MFEMLTGLPPFYDEDHNVMFENILNAEVRLDQPFLSIESKNLLQNLLEKDPVLRYQSIGEIMRDPWFSDVDWNLMRSKQVQPPLVPDINLCYFDKNDAESEDSPLFGNTGNLLHDNLNKSSAARRQSYYLHSTLPLNSCIDERTSFIRSASHMRQIFD